MASRASRLVRLVVLIALVCGAPRLALAQNGRIRGVVRDASGDPLAGVGVRATNQRTGLSSRATTAGDGSYTISGLAAGTYTVYVKAVAKPSLTNKMSSGAQLTVR